MEAEGYPEAASRARASAETGQENASKLQTGQTFSSGQKDKPISGSSGDQPQERARQFDLSRARDELLNAVPSHLKTDAFKAADPETKAKMVEQYLREEGDPNATVRYSPSEEEAIQENAKKLSGYSPRTF